MLKLVLFLFLARCVLSQSSLQQEIEEEWEKFKKIHVKSYEPGEEENRQLIFKENLLLIKEHNAEAKAGRRPYRLSVNKFSDLTHREFMQKMTGLILPKGIIEKRKEEVAGDRPHRRIKLPREFTWRASNVVTPVKNQMQCGSCWAFAATGALESMWARKTGDLLTLSEQNLVDCSTSQGNQGCHGGYPNWAFDYIRDNGGINQDACYPYSGVEDTCVYDDFCYGANLTSYMTVTYGDERQLIDTLYTKGPLAICIDAGQPDFASYSNGIYDNPSCSSDGVNHAVLVVGYGKYQGQNYWLIKNSWGTTWGEDGFIKIARNGKNLCGVATLASQPII